MISIPCGIKQIDAHTQTYSTISGTRWWLPEVVGVDGEEGEMKWVRWPKGTKVQLPGKSWDVTHKHGEYS